MNNKDKLIKDYINKHYQELLDCLKEINDNFDNFLNDQIIQKAISFDLFQIGELFNNLSNDFASKLNKRDVRGIIDIRNYIAHGYIYIKKSEIWNTIHNDLPRLISELEKIN